MTYNDKRKARYRAIRNAYGDPALANKYRSRSDTVIYNDLGIRVPKKMPQLKPMPSEALRKKQARRLERIQYGISIGLSVKEAKQLYDYKEAKIKSTRRYLDSLRRPNYTSAVERKRRYMLWRNWAINNTLPPALHRSARNFNRREEHKDKTPLGVKADFGYAMVYYIYVEGYTEAKARRTIAPDDFDDTAIRYLTISRIRA